MLYLVWSLPALVVIGAIVLGRVRVVGAALLGVGTALTVALTTAPMAFGLTAAAAALGRGGWIGWIAVPYIFGGVLFWQITLGTADAPGPSPTAAKGARARRRQLFAACFLIGPFAESATGFGVGIVGTVALVRRLDVPPVPLLVFGLLSQTLILWGGMGNGIIVGAAYARTDPSALAVHVSWFLVAYHLFWLPMFWRAADSAGVTGDRRERLGEATWIAAGLAGAIGATALLGAECAMLAAYAPLIVLRFLLDEHPSRDTLADTARRMWPFAFLLGWLSVSRLVSPLAGLLGLYRVQPFAAGPAWVPFFHAGTWLVVTAIVVAAARGQAKALGRELGRAWATSRLAILSVIAFSIMAELLAGSGIASAFAGGLYGVFGPSAVAVTSLVPSR